MSITLKCPKCGEMIAVESSAGLEKKNAECPKCHERQQVCKYLPKLSFKVGTMNYQLRFGKQWIGRLAHTNDAQVQIKDDTKYMSKHHAQVDISCVQGGLAVTFEEHGKNPTEMQGVPLMEDDIVYVNINDCLQLGNVRMYLAPEFGE